MWFFIANYLALTYEKVNTIDTQPWINVHAYVVNNWEDLPILIVLGKVINSGGNDNITKVITNAFAYWGWCF
jgi:hypothetical protein